MDLVTELEALSGSELLDHADEVATLQRRCEVQTLRIAVQHAVINNPDTLDPDLTKLPGRERTKRYGGIGTERVAEFACAELGARLGVSDWSAHSLMADALDLVVRLPQLWARVEALEVKASYARFVARRTRDLTQSQAAYVDAQVVESADGRIPWSRFEELVTGAIAASDPEAAAERERRAAEEQYANPARTSEDGMRRFYIRAGVSVIARLDATVTYLADILAALGDTDPVGHRRVKAILVLTHPGQAAELIAAFQAWRDRPTDPDIPEDHTHSEPAADGEAERTGEKPDIDWDRLLPAVQLFVHMYYGTRTEPSTGVARVEGIGPVTEAWVRRHLGTGAQVTVRPVLDIEGLAPVDGYEIPDRHRRAVHLMTPADTFPFASSTDPRTQQIDHTVPYRHGQTARGAGQSRIGNYGPMSRTHHRIKTFDHWKVKQPFPGVYLWQDPHGALYLVDCTGTRRIDLAA